MKLDNNIEYRCKIWGKGCWMFSNVDDSLFNDKTF